MKVFRKIWAWLTEPVAPPIKPALSPEAERLSNPFKAINKPIYRPAATYSASELCYDLIREFEGFASKPYVCPGKKLTIGYGHVIKKGEVLDHITKRQGYELLIKDVEVFEAHIRKTVKVDITQHMFDALVSFTFNLGGANFNKSTLRKKLNQGNYKGAQEEFSKWIYARKKILPGLVRRREAEAELFGRGL